MDKSEMRVMNPVAERQVRKSRLADRVADLKGKRVGLFWNGKPNGDRVLEEIANARASRFPGSSAVKMWEIAPQTRTVYGNPAENLKRMSQCADFIVSASGD